MIDINKFTLKAQEAIQKAQKLAGDKHHQQMEPEHLLAVLLEDTTGLVRSVLIKLGVPSESIQNKVYAVIEKFPKLTGGVGQIYLSPDLNKILEKSWDEAHQLKDEYVSVEHLFLSSSDSDAQAGRILKEEGVTRENILKVLQEIRGGQRVTDQNPEDKYQALKRYGRDLNDLARKGKLDPVIGRDEEVRRVLQVLSRRKKNNPLLIG